MKASLLMVQGTASSVGKSVIATGLCRWFRRQGLRVAPFKAQNMSNNSYVCRDGGEIGRAQFSQAEACELEPDPRMNPVLLKPEGDDRSQVIVMGRVDGSLRAAAYHERAGELWKTVQEALQSLRADFDLVVIEGAGSAAELNLRDWDIANMRLAVTFEAPVLLVGDIDRGGIFAALAGTLQILTSAERDLVKGLIVNRFRGDPALFASGIELLERLTARTVLGVVPYFTDLALPEEDAVALDRPSTAVPRRGSLDVAVLRLPHISNFDEFDALAAEPAVSLRYVDAPVAFGDPDVVILPGTKSTLADLNFLRERRLDLQIQAARERGRVIIGVCGGYQMLGDEMHDPDGVESAQPHARGLGLLRASTTFARQKRTARAGVRVGPLPGPLAALQDVELAGYHIHMGRTDAQRALFSDAPGDGAVSDDGRVLGWYLHGLFESAELRRVLIQALHDRPVSTTVAAAPEQRLAAYDRLADLLETSLDLPAIAAIAGIA